MKERRASALRAHVKAGGPEGMIAARVLQAMGLPLEEHPDVELPVPVSGPADRDLVVLVARLCGVSAVGIDSEKRKLWLRGPQAVVEPAVDMYRAERKAMHHRRKLSDIAFMHRRFGHLMRAGDGNSDNMSRDDIRTIVSMTDGVERAGEPRKRLTDS